MPVPKPHPDVSVPTIRNWLFSREKLIQQMLFSARTGRGDLRLLFSFSHDAASYRIAIDDYSAMLCDNLRLAAQTAAAIFLSASQDSGEIEIQLGDGPPVILPATGPSSEAHGGRFLTSFFLGAVCRDRHSVASLSGISMAAVRASRSKAEECSYLFGEALQHFWREEYEQASAFLLQALEATDPTQISEPELEGYILEVIVPQIECLYRLLLNDVGGLNDALAKGVEWHRKYWTRGKNREHPDGFFSVGLTGIAALAFDRSISIKVESPYLPRFLMEGGCIRSKL